VKKAHRVALQSLQQLRAYTFNHSDEKNRRGNDEWQSQTKLLDRRGRTAAAASLQSVASERARALHCEWKRGRRGVCSLYLHFNCG
jgi:hypothetical protein